MSIFLRAAKVKDEWTDYNNHMNLAYYIHLFDINFRVIWESPVCPISSVSMEVNYWSRFDHDTLTPVNLSVFPAQISLSEESLKSLWCKL